jgi:putative ABC transport system permease protein
MNFFTWIRLRFSGLGGARNRREEFERELESHLALEAEEQTESGASVEEARYAARRATGNPTLIAEEVHEIWSVAWAERLARDLRCGARALRKDPGFTLVAVLTLALGIGANTAIFSLIDALMLRPVALPGANQIVRIYSTKGGVPIAGYGYPGGPSPTDVQDFARRNHTFQEMVVYDTWRKNVSFGDAGSEPEQMRVGLVPAAYFEVLGVQPLMGRLFANEENQPGRNYVAAIGERLWKNRFAGDPAILGRKIVINDEPYTVVAVMPQTIPDWIETEGYREAGPVHIWTPFPFADAWTESSRRGRGDAALARIKPGVSFEQAQADLSAIAAQLAEEHPVDQGIGVMIKQLSDTRVGELRPVLLLLMAAVSLILLIACVNLANLLLARNSTRQRELAVRAALGAGRKGLVRQLLAETALLSVTGGVAGFALAQVGAASLTRIFPEEIPEIGSLGIDWRVLAFTFAASAITCLLFGLAPALTGTRLNLVDALKQGGRSGTGGVQSQRMRSVLVTMEMAMSLMLLVGAGLLVQSILRLERQSLGMRQDHLLKGHFYVPGARYPDSGAIARFCDEFGNRIRALPGVIDATVTTVYPPTDGWSQMLDIPGHPASRIQDVPTAQFGVVDAHWMRTLGISLIAGRDFSESDVAASPAVALINQELKRRYFPVENPIGRRIHIGAPQFLNLPPGGGTSDSANVTIIGVIGDFRNAGLVLPAAPQIVVLYSQHPLVNYGFKDVVIRTTSEPRLMAPTIRAELSKMDPDMPFAQVQTMQEHVDEQTGGQRFTTALLVLFALSGLALAVVGIYGVVSYLVNQRTQEMAVRLALGASPTRILWLVLRQSFHMALIGAAIGVAGAFAVRRLTAGLLFGISPLDPTTFIGSVALLLVVVAIASAVPGARAMRIQLVEALRQE